MGQSITEIEILLNTIINNAIKSQYIKDKEDYNTSKLSQATYNKHMHKMYGARNKVIKLFKILNNENIDKHNA